MELSYLIGVQIIKEMIIFFSFFLSLENKSCAVFQGP